MSDTNKKGPPVDERRRDHRIDVGLPFLLIDQQESAKWNCRTLDISPTGVLLALEKDEAPAPGTIVNAMVQGPAETGWEHINKRPMRVVRVQEHQTGLTYADLDSD